MTGHIVIQQEITQNCNIQALMHVDRQMLMQLFHSPFIQNNLGYVCTRLRRKAFGPPDSTKEPRKPVGPCQLVSVFPTSDKFT